MAFCCGSVGKSPRQPKQRLSGDGFETPRDSTYRDSIQNGLVDMLLTDEFGQEAQEIEEPFFWLELDGCAPEEASGLDEEEAGMVGECVEVMKHYEEGVVGLDSREHEAFATRLVRAHPECRLEELREKVRECMDWRRAQDMPSIWRCTAQDGHNIYASGCDRVGHPVLWWEVGTPEVWSETSLDNFCRIHIRRMERMLQIASRQADALGCMLYKSLWVVDLQHICWGHSDESVREQFKAATQIDEANYPEVVEKIVLLNASLVFRMLWKALQVFIPEKTKEKVIMLGEDYIEVLESLVDRAYIPVCYGGDNLCVHKEDL